MLTSRRPRASNIPYVPKRRQQNIILKEIEALLPGLGGAQRHVDQQLSEDFKFKVAIDEDTVSMSTDEDVHMQCNDQDCGFTFATPHIQETYPELPLWWTTPQQTHNPQLEHSVSHMEDVCCIDDKENIDPNTPGAALKPLCTAMNEDTACWGPVKRSRPSKSCLDPMDCSPTLPRKKRRVRRTLMVF